MSCTERPCAYREAYACDDEARLLGQAAGLCVIELSVRRDHGQDLEDLFLTDLPEKIALEALWRLELLLDAILYTQRANAWIGIAGNAGTPTFDHPDYERGVARYRMGASERLWRRYAALRPLIEEAKHFREIRELDERLAAACAS